MRASLRYRTDEDFRGKVLRGLKRRMPDVDIVRAQGEGLSGLVDPLILEWAAQYDRIVITHDAKTMPSHAYARVDAGLPMPGVCVVPQALPIGDAIEALLMVIHCSVRTALENQVLHLPL